jgi:S1-C subfamily serine protease
MNFIAILLFVFSHASTIKPTTVQELRKVTVKITNKESSSGGTGTIIESGVFGSLIITNKHVCESIETDWLIVNNNKGYRINRYKTFDRHDLCIIETKANLNVSVKISGTFPKIGDKSVVSGHPMLLPQTVTTGHYGDEIKINVVTSVRECTEEESTEDPMGCSFFGKPVTEIHDAQYSTNLIQPGNSGSGVFNEKGELSAVVFAGSQSLSFSFVVPLLYITYFIKNNQDYAWIKPTKHVETVETANAEKKLKEYLTFCGLNQFDKNCLKNKRDLLLR